MLQQFDQITFLCPVARTGGPEAIHQACYIFNKLGAKANIIGRTDHKSLSRTGNELISSVKFANINSLGYGNYLPVYTDRHRIAKDNLLVIPEVLAAASNEVSDMPCAVWWLAVDNAIISDRRFADPDFRKVYFSNSNTIHLYQSHYARDFLLQSGARSPMALTDYTDERFHVRSPQAPILNNKVAYNPKKGGEAAEIFFQKNPHFEKFPLQGFSKDQMLDVLRETAIYIDFGHFPGKDRIPREAAAAGCVVFLHRAGSGAFYEDFPVPNVFKFVASDVTSGDLAERVSAAIETPNEFWNLQANLRQTIAWEKHTFCGEVMRLLGRTPPTV